MPWFLEAARAALAPLITLTEREPIALLERDDLIPRPRDEVEWSTADRPCSRRNSSWNF